LFEAARILMTNIYFSLDNELESHDLMWQKHSLFDGMGDAHESLRGMHRFLGQKVFSKIPQNLFIASRAAKVNPRCCYSIAAVAHPSSSTNLDIIRQKP
jgi:hypothetical protein